MYSQTRVTVRPRATPQAAFSGAPARIIWSAESKSSRKLKAAMPMQTSEKMIASDQPERRPIPSPPPTPNIASTKLPSMSTRTPTMLATRKRVNFGVTRMAPVL